MVGDAGGLKDTGETTAEGQDGSVPEPGLDPGGNEDVPEGDVAVSDQEGTGPADGNSEYAIPSISQALPASVDAEAATGTDAGDEPVLSDQDVYLYCIDPEKLGTQIGEGALSFTPAENSLGSASLWHWMGTARVPLKPADEDYVAEGVKIAGNIDIYSTWLLESRMDQAVYKAYDSLFLDGDYPDVRVGGRTLVYDPSPDAVGNSYHVVWVRLVSATTSWVSDAGPGAAYGEGNVSQAANRSYHLDGYIVDHSTRASVQYVMVPGVVPLNNLSSMPEGFVPDMDNTYQLNYSNLLPNRTSKLDMDTDVPYHDVRLESAVDPYAGEKVWFLDPECTQPFDFGSTPITQASRAVRRMDNLCVFFIISLSIRSLGSDSFAGHPLCVEYSFDFFAGVLGIPLIYDITEGCKIVAHLILAVHSVIDSNEAHVQLWKTDFRIHSHFQIVSPEPGHIFDNYGFNVPSLNIGQHFLKAGAVEICSAVAVIHIVTILFYAMVAGVPLQNLLLVLDAVAVPFIVIVAGQTAVESVPFVRGGL